jgi:hypothetical protein
MATPFGHTVDGFETQFGTNHLGHFVLVNRKAPLIRTGGRLINLSSAGHRRSNVDLDDPNFERRLMNLLLLMAARRRRTSLLQSRSTSAIGKTVSEPRRRIREGSGPKLLASRLETLIDGINKQLAAEGKPPFEFKTIAQRGHNFSMGWCSCSG